MTTGKPHVADTDRPDPVRSRSVVVAAHGSEGSLEAVRWSQHMAELIDARLVVIDANENDADASDNVLQGDELRGRLSRHIAQCGLHAADVIVESGPLADVVGHHIAGADLIVIGAHAPDGIRTGRHRDLVARVARSASCPIVVVPSGGDWSEDGRVVLVGVDGSDANRSVFRWARWLGELTDRRVVAVHVSDPLYRTFTPLDQPSPTDLEVRREVEYSDVEFVDLVGAEPGYSLADYAKIRDAGMLVVGARVRHSMGGRLLGGVTSDVVEAAVCPIAVIPWGFQVGA